MNKFYNNCLVKNIAPTICYFLCSIFLCYLSSPQNLRELVLFARFYMLLNIYIYFIWVMFNDSNKFFKILIHGQISLTTGLLFLVFLFVQIPTNSYMISLLRAWLFFLVYLILLSRLAKFLKNYCGLWAKPLFAGIFTLAIGNLFILSVIFKYIKILSPKVITICLYFNPVIVTSQCLKNYDYLRGPFFYDIYPITSYLGNFKYPKFWYVILFYLLFIFLIEILNSFLKKLKNEV